MTNSEMIKTLDDAKDLINRQQAEIERYKHSIKLLEDDVATAKSEAIKEFADELIGTCYRIPQHYFTWAQVVFEINNLVKVRTEGTNNEQTSEATAQQTAENEWSTETH